MTPCCAECAFEELKALEALDDVPIRWLALLEWAALIASMWLLLAACVMLAIHLL